MSYKNFIFDFIKSTSHQGFSYLELGVHVGELMDLISQISNNCVGVDVVDNRKNKNRCIFHTCTTDDFFKTNLKSFDYIFIDASHQIEQVKKDLYNSIKVLNKNGIILLHDTDPNSKELIDEIGNTWCGSAYRIVEVIRDLPEYESITLPIDVMGLTIMKRKNDRRVLSYKGL